jgi:hypothetical protein
MVFELNEMINGMSALEAVAMKWTSSRYGASGGAQRSRAVRMDELGNPDDPGQQSLGLLQA